MKYKKIMTYFLLALAVCIFLRTIQLLNTIDGTTGFFVPEYASTGFTITVLICAVTVAIAIISLMVRRCPKKMPKVNNLLGIMSVVLGITVLMDLFTREIGPRVAGWQITLVNLFGILTALFFVVYGITAFVNIKLNSMLYIIPVLYWTVKLVELFTDISSLALIVDNLFLVLSNCAVLLFMLELSKFANSTDDEVFRPLLASGLTSVILCGVCSVPTILLKLAGRSSGIHESAVSPFSMLVVGIFVAVMTLEIFGNKNLKKKKHRRHSSSRFLPGETPNNFYIDI